MKKIKKGQLIIEKVGINAPIYLKKVKKDGIMEMPDSPDDVVLYDFRIFPGVGGEIGKIGNAILTGHVDSGFEPCKEGTIDPPCEAVLWDLDKIKKNDEVKIIYGKKSFRYNVISNRRIKPLGNAWKKIFLAGSGEIITILTCAGEFDEEKHDYKSRQVVKALRKVT